MTTTEIDSQYFEEETVFNTDEQIILEDSIPINEEESTNPKQEIPIYVQYQNPKKKMIKINY